MRLGLSRKKWDPIICFWAHPKQEKITDFRIICTYVGKYFEAGTKAEVTVSFDLAGGRYYFAMAMCLAKTLPSGFVGLGLNPR